MKVPASVRQAHQFCSKKYNGFVGFFAGAPGFIDRHWRWMDFKMNRNYGGWPERRFGIRGYSMTSLILPFLAFVFLLRGPILRPGFVVGWIVLAAALLAL